MLRSDTISPTIRITAGPFASVSASRRSHSPMASDAVPPSNLPTLKSPLSRARRRPTLRAARRPESLHRRIDASLTRRNLAASRVFSNLPVLYFTISHGQSSTVLRSTIELRDLHESAHNPQALAPQLEWLREARGRGLLSRLPDELVMAVVTVGQRVQYPPGTLALRWDESPKTGIVLRGTF